MKGKTLACHVQSFTFRSENCCWILGRSIRYFSISSFSLSSLNKDRAPFKTISREQNVKHDFRVLVIGRHVCSLKNSGGNMTCFFFQKPSVFASFIHPFVQCCIYSICFFIILLIRPTGEQATSISIKLQETRAG